MNMKYKLNTNVTEINFETFKKILNTIIFVVFKYVMWLFVKNYLLKVVNIIVLS